MIASKTTDSIMLCIGSRMGSCVLPALPWTVKSYLVPADLLQVAEAQQLAFLGQHAAVLVHLHACHTRESAPSAVERSIASSTVLIRLGGFSGSLPKCLSTLSSLDVQQEEGSSPVSWH